MNSDIQKYWTPSKFTYLEFETVQLIRYEEDTKLELKQRYVNVVSLERLEISGSTLGKPEVAYAESGILSLKILITTDTKLQTN